MNKAQFFKTISFGKKTVIHEAPGLADLIAPLYTSNTAIKRGRDGFRLTHTTRKRKQEWVIPYTEEFPRTMRLLGTWCVSPYAGRVNNAQMLVKAMRSGVCGHESRGEPK